MHQQVRVGIVGVGKIARDQHIPSIAADARFELVAAASRHACADGVPTFLSLEQLLASGPTVDAIVICTPPQTHYELGRLALRSGKHVLMEKPPCTSLAQLAHLLQLASVHGVVLYQTWHSQMAAGVASADHWLTERRIRRIRVTWKEDVRVWHPGQRWIWEPGGFGVFDPGINAVSIVTRLLREPLFTQSATLYVPANCATPIAAHVHIVSDSGIPVELDLDFRHTGTQTWDIELATDNGTLTLSRGGQDASVDGTLLAPPSAPAGEYGAIYARFAELLASGQSEVDCRPMQLVADVFLMGRQIVVEPFEDAVA